jgi:acyl dehydratase
MGHSQSEHRRSEHSQSEHRRFDEVDVGDELGPTSVTVRRADLVRYAGASGDFNPIHWNERFAREVGLPDVIAHGMYTMALGARLITGWAGRPDALIDYGVRFTHPVVVPDNEAGAVVELTGKVTKKLDDRCVRVEISARCDDHKVLGKAAATVRLA